LSAITRVFCKHHGLYWDVNLMAIDVSSMIGKIQALEVRESRQTQNSLFFKRK